MRALCSLTALVAFASHAPAAEPKPLEFKLTFDKAALDEPFTGRVYVTVRTASAPPAGLNWFQPQPGLAKDVTNWKPGAVLTLDQKSRPFPAPFALPTANKLYVSAVMDRDLGGIDFLASPGNVYSKAVELDPKVGGTVELKLDQVYRPREFKETDTVKLVEIESKLLTKFHGKPTAMRAGVVLPPSFAKEPDRKYPVVYEVPGFGGNHFAAFFAAARKAWDVAGTEMIWVVLDGNCRLGHHVFADSANNGPVGTALVEELIPYLEKQYRGSGVRFTTGHSSGGWSSLWLQVAYPDTFAGCWSTAPDPVDFRDFQMVDVYARGANIFTDADGKKRPLSRPVGGQSLVYQSFSDMEEYMGRGGQLGSFEAVFSPKGADGKPRKLWDRKTGAIDPQTAKAWEKYDIRLVLERNWKALGPKLAGKLHVYTGDEDTFYLDGAARLLKKSLANLGSDAAVELFPKKHHGNLVDAALRKRMNEEMAAAAQPSKGRPDVFAVNKVLGRGINFGNALEAPKEGDWGLKLDASYFKLIKDAGFATVRVPVKWSAHAAKDAPYTIDADFFKRIDWVLDQAEANKLNVVLNVHHYDEMDKDPDKHLPRLVAIWEQLAARYKDRPPSLVFELLNEPHDKLVDQKWNDAIPPLLKAIRATNPTRAVVVGPPFWNGIWALPKLKLPNDPNLILTVHYYEPYKFTHQGAPWGSDEVKKLKDLKWEGTDAELKRLRDDFDKAAEWAKKNNRPVFLGEFGAFEKADLDSRAKWTAAVAREAEARGFSWAYWEFAAGFGAYDRDKKAWRDPLLRALVPSAK